MVKNSRQLLTSIALGSVAMFSTPFSTSAQEEGLQIGDRFPEIVLPSLQGRTPLSIASFRGRKLVLHVWASW